MEQDWSIEEMLPLQERSVGKDRVQLMYFGPGRPLEIYVTTSTEHFVLKPQIESLVLDAFNHPFSPEWYDQRVVI